VANFAGRCWGSRGNRAKNNFDLDLVQVVVCQFDDLVEAFLADVHFGLLERLMLALDDGLTHSSLTGLVSLDTFLEGHAK
jgi:hypothetical protein